MKKFFAGTVTSDMILLCDDTDVLVLDINSLQAYGTLLRFSNRTTASLCFLLHLLNKVIRKGIGGGGGGGNLFFNYLMN